MSGVIRVEKRGNFTVMSNAHLRDPRLSLKAVGLMSKMLSNADGWEYSIAGLTAGCREGRDAVGSALRELEAAGYLVRHQTREGGSFAKCDYTLFEEPQTGVSPLPGFPSTVNPLTGNPLTGNPQQRITIAKNNQEKEIPPCSPPEGTAPAEDAGSTPRRSRRRGPKTQAEWKPERFERFWDFYPRGEAKQAAIKAWDQLMPDDALLIVMGRALRRQMNSEEWQEGVGIPYASTWLNQRRWEDERIEGVPSPAVSSAPIRVGKDVIDL